ncbi:MAG: acetyl-CoA decarbonylase/synthase complex subunit gamma [Candidatus Bathyarchaeia archaeon]
MSGEKTSPITVYRLLPGRNCGECNVPTCMAFALKLMEDAAELDECPHLTGKNKDELLKLISPPVRKACFGRGRILCIGGEKSLHRHIHRFYHPTALGVEVEVENHHDETLSQIRRIGDFKLTVGWETYGVDFIYLKCSKLDERTLKLLRQVDEYAGKPLMISCASPIGDEALDTLAELKPVLCGAHGGVLEQYIEVSRGAECPIAVSSRSVSELYRLSEKASSKGCQVVLNPTPRNGLKSLVSTLIQIRIAAIEHGVSGFQHPILAFPAQHEGFSSSILDPVWMESLTGAACVLRYADAVVLSWMDWLAMAPLYALRQGYYSNPREPAKVTPGLYVVGKPGSHSPVVLTTNYALTYYLVFSDLQAGKASCYLLVVDSQGMSVENAVAGGMVDGESIAKLLKEVEGKVSERMVVLPRGFSKMKGEVEEGSGWRVLIGPEDSAELPTYLRKLGVTEA